MKIFLLLFSSIMLGMCSNQAKMGENASPSNIEIESAPSTTMSQSKKEAAPSNQKLILTADLSMEVKDYDTSRKALRKTIQQFGAQIFEEAEQRLDYRIENRMTIRIEPSLFDSLITEIQQISIHIDSKNINTQDVTTQYVDIESRLTSKRAVIEQYQELMKSAKKISEILEINEEMNAVIEEVESAEAQLRTLRDQVQLSTLHLTMYQNFNNIAAHHEGFGSRLGNALSSGWQGLVSVLIGLIYLWPLLLAAGIILFFILRSGKRARSAKKIMEQ